MPTSFPRTWRAALALAAAVSVPTAALASTAANTAITNTATVHFNDAGGNPQTPITASATVTVTLVPSAVLLSSPVDQTIAMGTSATLSYTITGTANGPDTYKLGVTANASNLSAVTPPSRPTSRSAAPRSRTPRTRATGPSPSRTTAWRRSRA